MCVWVCVCVCVCIPVCVCGCVSVGVCLCVSVGVCLCARLCGADGAKYSYPLIERMTFDLGHGSSALP